ncbi:nucleoid-associated protein [Arthrobacter globiformis]|uniref:nucleoid-associated protein n=1 Tax=Arthrobacter globiformis TaxID=1665 RepID=UPI003979D2E7
MPDYSTLELSSIYMHQIALAQNGEKSFEAFVTDVPVELDSKDTGYLTDRFCDALDKRALGIVPNPDVDSPTPSVLRQHFSAPDLKSTSQQLAVRLSASQRLTAKTGLLVVADATLDDMACVLVAKVEHQEAMQAELQILENGDRALAIKRIPDLVFGEQNRIYKVSVLFSPLTDADPVEGVLADIQNGGGFANYYLGEFLGMKLADEPEVMTERYLNQMTSAIQQSTLDADEKVQAQAALAIAIKSNSQTIDAKDFIADFIPHSHQMDVLRAAENRGVPMVAFTKDSRRIKPKLDNLKINLGNEISLVAPPHLVGGDGQVKVAKRMNSGSEELYDVTIEGVPLGTVTNTRSR